VATSLCPSVCCTNSSSPALMRSNRLAPPTTHPVHWNAPFSRVLLFIRSPLVLCRPCLFVPCVPVPLVRSHRVSRNPPMLFDHPGQRPCHRRRGDTPIAIRWRRPGHHSRSNRTSATSSPHFGQSRRPSPSCRITLPRWPFPLRRRVNLRSGVNAAVDCQVRTVDV
jgi:hypothetical protein